MPHDRPPGLDAFWQTADDESSDENPLERELCNRLDAVARYQAMIADADAADLDGAVHALERALQHEAAAVDRLRVALRRSRPQASRRVDAPEGRG